MVNTRFIWRRRYANSVQCLRLQNWSLFSWLQEVVESGHNYRNIDQEIQRQKAIENFVPSLLELILINKILIFLEPWIKYTDTFKKSTEKL